MNLIFTVLIVLIVIAAAIYFVPRLAGAVRAGDWLTLIVWLVILLIAAWIIQATGVVGKLMSLA